MRGGGEMVTTPGPSCGPSAPGVDPPVCCVLTVTYVRGSFCWLMAPGLQFLSGGGRHPGTGLTDFSSQWSVNIWIVDYILTKSIRLKLNVLIMDLFPTNTQLFTSQDVNWWTGVVWITCDVFISCLDSHSDATHSLQRMHWWASDVKRHFSKSDPIK